MSINSIKCVAVGDGFVGKTSLLARICGKELNPNYTATVFDNVSITRIYNEQTYQVTLFDTAGQEEYNLLRKQVYDSTNVFLICFSVISTDSFLNVKQVWLPEINECQDCQGASKILIGTKSDLRNDTETIDKLNASGALFVNETVAKNLAKDHKMKYIECSAVTQGNIQEVLNAILEVNCLRIQETKKISTSSSWMNPFLRCVTRALCCKNN